MFCEWAIELKFGFYLYNLWALMINLLGLILVRSGILFSRVLDRGLSADYGLLELLVCSKKNSNILTSINRVPFRFLEG